MLLVGGKTDPSSDRVSGLTFVVLDSKAFIFNASLCLYVVVFVCIILQFGRLILIRNAGR